MNEENDEEVKQRINKTRRKVLTSVFISLIIIVILFMTWLFIYVVSNKVAFFGNPFVYGAGIMGNVECSCTQRNEGQLPANFWFNDTTINFDTAEYLPIDENTYPKLNISNIVIVNETE